MKKALSKGLLHWVMAPLARLIYAKYRPTVVAVTGSVGKTTTREAIYQVLSSQFSVAKAAGAGNAEWSTVATLLNPGYQPFSYNEKGWGVMQPHHALWCWLVGLVRFFLPLSYPKIFVLELGIDGPGDMAFLNSLMRYDVAIVTRVGQAHLEFFKDYSALFAEKTAIFNALKPSGLAIAGSDQEDLVAEVDKLVVRHIKVGKAADADVRQVSEEVVADKVRVKYLVDSSELQVELPLGQQYQAAAAIAIAVAKEFAMTNEQIADSLNGLPTVGRRFEVHVLKNGITVIDDAYNANLDSVRMALSSFADISAVKRVVVLGDMKELGAVSEASHLEVGRLVAQQADRLFTVGELGDLIAQEAVASGMEEARIKRFGDTKSEAEADGLTDAILQEIGDNTAVLIKASRAMGLGRIARNIIEKLS